MLEAAEALGVDVPGDLSVVGYDDIEVARYAGLTTVAQPLEESGARGAELLLAALDGGHVDGEQLAVELVVRATTPAAGSAAGKHAGTARGYVPDHTHGQRGSSCPREFCTCCAWRSPARSSSPPAARTKRGGGGGGTEETGATEGAKAIDPASMEGATGDVTYCLGKDTSGDKTAAIKRFNEQNPDIKAELLEFSTSADEQRTQFVQRQEAKSGECDVFYADVIWTAEFASQKWIFDMSPYVEERKDES